MSEGAVRVRTLTAGLNINPYVSPVDQLKMTEIFHTFHRLPGRPTATIKLDSYHEQFYYRARWLAHSDQVE